MLAFFAAIGKNSSYDKSASPLALSSAVIKNKDSLSKEIRNYGIHGKKKIIGS